MLLVWFTSGAVVMNALGSRAAMPPTQGVSKCLVVSMSDWILAVSLWITAAFALTMTSVPTAPSSKTTSMRRIWLPNRMMLSATNVLNPGFMALSR